MTVSKSFRFEGQTLITYLDDQDADLLVFDWGIVRKKSAFYVASSKRQPGRYLHQIILERKLGHSLETGKMADHVDRDTMNNRRRNLRPATSSQNNANSLGKRRKHILPHGVYLTSEGKFNTGLSHEGTNIYLGTFETPEEAHAAYAQKHAEVWGEFSPYFEDNLVFTTLVEVFKFLSTEASPTLEAFKTDSLQNDLARYGLCLILEAAELVNSLPWKLWQRNPRNIQDAVSEFADLLCFMGSIISLFKHLGVEEYDLAAAYLDKVDENRERFARHLEEVDSALIQ